MKVRSVLVGLVVLALLAAGGLLVWRGLAEQPPEATPTPSEEFTITAEQARELALGAAADGDLFRIPEGEDFGPYVRTEPVPTPPDGGTASADWSGRLQIPSIMVDAPIIDEGVTPQNTMSLPDDLSLVGRLETTAPLEAAEGVTLLAGHVTWRGDHGALYFLGEVGPGARVDTWDEQGERTTWAVSSVELFDKQALPDRLFTPDGERRLVLVTCGGPIIQLGGGDWTHESNIVVTAVPVDSAASTAR
ncbi:class F sortase [Ornithinicoccus hortensis]|uniref:Sortase (Surface protein transpeptidase) n=1 Tax=Ornithinicoccus hortensis TaxID=82346 RepID=A0A542YNK7_9MICO|nr:class F sortase [Ornithinicoccus hortensis]TQL49680.1 sortase (surface protein transpeptidase) [Ornithinicoccus hortensis]